MKPDRTLHVQVAAAVGGLLVGRGTITLAEVEAGLPPAIRAGRPSHKSMTKALAAAGWVGARQVGGAVVYRAPGASDDGPLGDNVGDEQLQLLIERIQRLKEERKAINEDIKEVFGEAKSLGFEPSGMRQVLKELEADPEQRIAKAAIIDLYRQALGLAVMS